MLTFEVLFFKKDKGDMLVGPNDREQGSYTGGKNVWGDRPLYLVKQPQKKWACDFHDDALPLSFQLQVAEVIF